MTYPSIGDRIWIDCQCSICTDLDQTAVVQGVNELERHVLLVGPMERAQRAALRPPTLGEMIKYANEPPFIPDKHGG